MWISVTVMFAIGLMSALLVREWWAVWPPTILFLAYFAVSAIDGPILYDFVMLFVFLLAPALVGVATGTLLVRLGSRTHRSQPS